MNLFHMINYDAEGILPMHIRNAYIDVNGMITLLSENKSLIINPEKNNPFAYFSDRTGKKSKHQFNDSLKIIIDDSVADIEMLGMDRMFVLHTDRHDIFVNIIPGSFNFIIMNKHSIIEGLYSYKKLKDGSIEYRKGDKFSIPEYESVMKHSRATAQYMEKNNIAEDEYLKKSVFRLYMSNGRYSILPHIAEGDALAVSHSPSELISAALNTEHKDSKESLIERTVSGLNKRLEASKRKLKKLEDKDRIIEEIRLLEEKVAAMQAHAEELNGKDKVLLHSVSDPDRELTVELSKTKKPYENIEMYFDKVKNLKRKLKADEQRKHAVKKEIDEIESLIKKAEAGALEKPEEGREKKPEKGRVYVSPGNHTVIAGRNAEENDYITRNMTAKGDLFFHAREKRGSHVILKSGGRHISKPDIEFAAKIAAYFSAGKHSGLVEVQYTDVKYVSKRKGSKAGEVVMARETVIFVKPGIPDSKGEI